MPVKVREQYKDISGQPINAGDMLILYNPAKEERHKFFVEEVDEITETTRRIRARVVESTDLTLKPGITVLPLKLDASVPQLGVVIPHDIMTKGLTQKELDDVIAVELRKFLDNKPPKYSAKFRTCVEFLQDIGLLDRVSDYEKQLRPRLRRVLQKNKDLFRSDGGTVFSTGKPIAEAITGYSNNPMSTLKVVDFPKLTMGLRLILESGVFGDIRFTNLE